jgi:hypothetical protein
MSKLTRTIAATVLCMAAASFATQAQADCDDDETAYSRAERLISEAAGRHLDRARRTWHKIDPRCDEDDDDCEESAAAAAAAAAAATAAAAKRAAAVPADQALSARKTGTRRQGANAAMPLRTAKASATVTAETPDAPAAATECKKYFPGLGKMLRVPCAE